MSKYLFAYGTLQPGCAPPQMEEVVAKMRAIGNGFVRGRLYDLGGYPGAVPDPHSAGKIFGTIMELPGDLEFLPLLDSYEGFDPQSPATSEYIRELREVELTDGRALACWFYRYNPKPDATRAIQDGVWRAR